jgi:hypothetical protein
VPLLALYLPLRISWTRDRKAVRRALAQWDGEPALETFLARRAIAHLPFHELRELGYDGAEGSGARSDLAAAELRRLGLGPQESRRLAPRRRRERALR